jgi:hypothetical protein
MGSGRSDPKRRVSCRPTPVGATAHPVAHAGRLLRVGAFYQQRRREALSPCYRPERRLKNSTSRSCLNPAGPQEAVARRSPHLTPPQGQEHAPQT